MAGLICVAALLCAAVLAGLLLARLLVHRRLTERLAGVATVVRRWNAGERQARAEIGPGSSDVRVIATALNALADEVESWRAEQAESERLHRTVSEISRTIRAELDLDSVLDAPMLVGPALGADRAWLRLARDGRLEGVVRQWQLGELRPLDDIPLGDVPLGDDDGNDDGYETAVRLWHREEVLARPDLTTRLEQEPAALQLFVAVTGVRSLLVVPIGAGDSVLGVLTWAMVDRPRAWTRPEVAAAQRVAADLGRAIVHASLYERQLEMVGKLRDLERRKDDFLSTVSHELRTPLTSIIGYLELVREGAAGELPPPMRKMLDVVDRNAIRLRELIEDLLLLARIEDGSLNASIDQVVVAELIRHAVDAVRPQADDGDVRLSVDAGPATLRVSGDARQLDMVVLNIISNAVKFTPAGGHVGVKVRHDAETNEVLLTCADSGIGIPERDLAGLFSRFFRASNATSHAIPGTGLGMSVIKGIVDAHGGAVALTSREGRGTIVTVRLPGALLAAAEKAPEPVSELGMPAPGPVVT